MSDSPGIRADLRRFWVDQPDAARVSKATGFAATHWSWGDGPHETSGEASTDRHTLSVCLDPLVTEFALDGRPAFAGRFRPGMLALIPAGRRPRAIQLGKARKLHLSVPHSLVAEAIGDGRGVGPSAEAALERGGVKRDLAATMIARRVVENLADRGVGASMLFDALGLEIAVHMARFWTREHGPQDGAPAPLAPFVLNRVLELMRADLARDISLAELARCAGLSPFHFARAFKASTGLPPHRYLVQMRLHHVRHRLQVTDLPIAEISAEAGYDNPSYLARLFRKAIGVTPAQYRRRVAV